MASLAASKKRNYLPLKKKVELIKHAEKNPGLSVRTLGGLFDCGKTQVGQILKSKESLLAMYESNASGSRVHTGNSRPSEFAEVNKALYEWYVIACSKNIYPGGPQLREKAKQIAEHLGKSGFKGSRGWLDKWKKRYNVKQLRVCGESGDVRGETVDSWKERLPEIVRGYSKENIWNMDESGVFWQALPESGFGQKGKQCKGGKKSKKRVTVAFFVSAAGTKEKPIVIWKSENPRCLKRFNKADLPVNYFSQKKSWMTGAIMEAILTKLNHQLSRNNQHILLFMDNAGCHPEELVSKFSNIKICFLPANTTSKLQPLDLGIIQNFKVHYRHLFLRYVLSKIDECETASDVVKSINILVAIRWVAVAWSKVRAETISKCFRKAGILTDDLGVVSCPLEDDADPFLEADACVEIESLIEKTMPAGEGCTVTEYLGGEDDLPICTDLDSDRWEDNFMAELGQQDEEDEEGDEEDEEGDEGMEDEPLPPLKVQSFKEAIESLENVQKFLESRGYIQEALGIGSAVDTVAGVKLHSSVQTSLRDYYM